MGCDAALLTCAASTFYGVGMIWILQLNHYPLYAVVGRDAFTGYMAAHNRRLLLPVVLPSMVAAASSLWLWLDSLAKSAASIPFVIVLLNGCIMASTIFVQGPAHRQLEHHGFSNDIIDRIVATNWVRTVAWSVNGALVSWLIATRLSGN